MLLRIETHQVHSFSSTDCNVSVCYFNLESLRKKWCKELGQFCYYIRAVIQTAYSKILSHPLQVSLLPRGIPGF